MGSKNERMVLAPNQSKNTESSCLWNSSVSLSLLCGTVYVLCTSHKISDQIPQPIWNILCLTVPVHVYLLCLLCWMTIVIAQSSKTRLFTFSCPIYILQTARNWKSVSHYCSTLYVGIVWSARICFECKHKSENFPIRFITSERHSISGMRTWYCACTNYDALSQTVFGTVCLP